MENRFLVRIIPLFPNKKVPTAGKLTFYVGSHIYLHVRDAGLFISKQHIQECIEYPLIKSMCFCFRRLIILSRRPYVTHLQTIFTFVCNVPDRPCHNFVSYLYQDWEIGRFANYMQFRNVGPRILKLRSCESCESIGRVRL